MEQQAQGVQELIVQVSQGLVVVDGGLSQLCTDALMQLYPQENEQSIHISLESHEIDLVTTLGVWDGLHAADKLPKDPQERIDYLYATRQGDVTMADVLRFSSALDTLQESEAALYLPEDTQVDTAFATEMLKIAQTRNVKVLRSVQELTDHYRRS